MINNVNSFSANQPLSQTRSERTEKLEKALDDMRVQISALSPEQAAAKREYGHQMVDDISSARFNQPAAGQSESDFSVLAARLTAGA